MGSGGKCLPKDKNTTISGSLQESVRCARMLLLACTSESQWPVQFQVRNRAHPGTCSQSWWLATGAAQVQWQVLNCAGEDVTLYLGIQAGVTLNEFHYMTSASLFALHLYPIHTHRRAQRQFDEQYWQYS